MWSSELRHRALRSQTRRHRCSFFADIETSDLATKWKFTHEATTCVFPHVSPFAVRTYVPNFPFLMIL
jgi:hypothetical protein